MKWLNHKIVIVFAIVLMVAVALAQQNQNNFANQRKALETQRKELLKKIQETKAVLFETRKKQTKSLADLKIISRQIETRVKVITNVAFEIIMLDRQIEEQQKIIESLKADMMKLKQDYGKSLLGAYKQRNVYDKVLFVFSAQSFNQAVKRIDYLNQLGDYRKRQAELILHTQNQIIAELNELMAIKLEKQGLLKIKAEEKKDLELDKKEESEVLSKLQDREKELRRILAENEKAARKLNEAIADMIQKEISEARAREESKRGNTATPGAGKTKPTETKKAASSSTELYLTPEAQKLSNDFELNKNLLPWPVERGIISEKFGTHPHASLKGVMVNNNGIDIQTQPNAPVRSVFKGTVKSIFSIPGMGKIVLISHGKYYTAYAKLLTVMVKEGQTVDTKQQIGTVLTNDEQETEVHFEIWKVQQKQNPEDWLKN